MCSSLFKDNQIMYEWNQGDFMIIDNSVSAHSREPFDGRRIVYAAIANGRRPCDLEQPSLTFSHGEFIPAIGLGMHKVPKEKAADAVFDGIKKGYRTIDSACDYGNEQEVGAAE